MKQHWGDSPRRWLGSEPLSGDPELPAGTKCLADHATAPGELLRRLKQVAVAHGDEGQELAIGQRLVTRDGRMRRWDGFVAEGAGAAAAERLLRANRLAALSAELPGLGRDDVHIEVGDGRVQLSGRRGERDLPCEQYHRVERGHGTFCRTFVLPLPVDADRVTADLHDGVLTVICPKTDNEAARRIHVS